MKKGRKMHLGVRTRIIAAFGGVLIFVLAMMILSFITTKRLDNMLQQTANAHIPALSSAEELAHQGKSLVVTAALLINTDDKWERLTLVDRTKDRERWMRDLVSQLRDLGVYPERLDAIERYKSDLVKSFYELNTAITQRHELPMGARNPMLDEQIQRMLRVNSTNSEKLTFELVELVDDLRADVDAGVGDVDTQVSRTNFIMFGAGVVVLIGVVTLALYLTRIIARRLETLQQSMSDIATGNSNEPIPVTGQDEISQMGHALNIFVDKLNRREADLQELVDRRTHELLLSNQSLAAKDRRLRNLFEVASDWFWEIDKDMRIASMSNACRLALGLDKDVFGQTIFDFLLRPNVSAEPKEMRVAVQALRNRKPFRLFQFSVYRSGGGITHLQASGVPVYNDRGMFGGFQVALSDISQVKQSELERRHAQKMLALGNLAGGVAHSFNNIFQPIMTLSDLTKKAAPANSDIQEHMRIITESSQRGKALCERILLFSRQDEPEMSLLDIGELVHDTLKLFVNTMPTSIELVEDIDEDVGEIYGDAAQIEAMLLNLMSNATDAIDNQVGRIEVRLKRTHYDDVEFDLGAQQPHEHYAQISVKDSGCGMNKRTRERIFDPFFTTKGLGKGTGLGLAMSSGITVMHGGGISVKSAPGAGSTFNIFLPISATLDQTATNREAP